MTKEPDDIEKAWAALPDFAQALRKDGVTLQDAIITTVDRFTNEIERIKDEHAEELAGEDW